jgi:hypothetical protein
MRVTMMPTRLPKALQVSEVVKIVMAVAVEHMGKEVALDSLGH